MSIRLHISLLALLLALIYPWSTAQATDYPASNEDIWPSQNDVAQTAGNGKKLLENQWAHITAAFTQNNYSLSGLTVPGTSGSLSINVAAGTAYLAGRWVSIPGTTSVTATASLTNYVFLKLSRDGSNLATGAVFEVNTTNVAPADSTPIATLVASGSAITSTTDVRRVGPWRAPVPLSIGAGSTRSHEGSVTIAANQNLSGIHYYNDFTLNASTTLTVPSGKHRVVIIASGTITINGTITAAGAGSAGGAGAANDTVAGSPGSPGTDQEGAAGGNGTATGPGAAGTLIWNGVPISLGAQETGSDVLALADPTGAMGGGGGGGGGANSAGAGGNGGPGGGSIVLIAPTIILGGAAILNTSGSAGSASGTGGTGGTGGAGNIYMQARSYTDNGATFTQTGGRAGVKQILLY